jgi:hypothetical protein
MKSMSLKLPVIFDLIYALIESLDIDNINDRMYAFELVRSTVYEWLDVIYEEEEEQGFDEYLGFAFVPFSQETVEVGMPAGLGNLPDIPEDERETEGDGDGEVKVEEN